MPLRPHLSQLFKKGFKASIKQTDGPKIVHKIIPKLENDNIYEFCILSDLQKVSQLLGQEKLNRNETLSCFLKKGFKFVMNMSNNH